MQVTQDIDKTISTLEPLISSAPEVQAAWAQLCLLAQVGQYTCNVINGIAAAPNGSAADGAVGMIQELVKSYDLTV